MLHYIELFDQLGLTERRQPRRLLARRSAGGPLRHRAEAPPAPPGAGRAGRAAGAGHRRSTTSSASRPRSSPGRLVHRMDTLAAAPPDRSPRRRLHRRPLPRDPHHGHHAVGAPVRPRSLPALARPGRHPGPRGVGRGRPARARRRWRRPGRPCCPNATVATFPEAGHLVLDESAEAREAVARFCAASG